MAETDPRSVPLASLEPAMLEGIVEPQRARLESIMNPQRKRPADLVEWVPFFRAAATKHRLTPEVVAAFVLAEMGHMLPYETPLGNIQESTTDQIKSLWDPKTSIGPGQVQIATVKKHDLLGMGKSSDGEIRTALLDPQRNIEATAQYIRLIADLGAKFPDTPEFAADPDFTYWRSTHQPQLDLRELARDAGEWKLGHVILLGSEYTTHPFATHKPLKWDFGWGFNVLRAYKDILASGIFEVDEGPASESWSPGPVIPER